MQRTRFARRQSAVATTHAPSTHEAQHALRCMLERALQMLRRYGLTISAERTSMIHHQSGEHTRRRVLFPVPSPKTLNKSTCIRNQLNRPRTYEPQDALRCTVEACAPKCPWLRLNYVKRTSSSRQYSEDMRVAPVAIGALAESKTVTT
jgi:hypothetical protein